MALTGLSCENKIGDRLFKDGTNGLYCKVCGKTFTQFKCDLCGQKMLELKLQQSPEPRGNELD